MISRKYLDNYCATWNNRVSPTGEEPTSSTPSGDARKEAVAWAYQFASIHGASVAMLDNLSAVAQGELAKHEWEVVEPVKSQILDGVFDHEAGCRAPDYSACTCVDILRAKIARLESEFREVSAQSERNRQKVIAAQKQTEIIAAEKDTDIIALRRCIHHWHGQAQPFERCESAWCHPTEDNNPARESAEAYFRASANEIVRENC